MPKAAKRSGLTQALGHMKFYGALTLFFLLAGCASTQAMQEPHAQLVPNGTYTFHICNASCEPADRITGIFVLERSRFSTAGLSEAMRFLLRADASTFEPNYCYYLDPETSNKEGTPLEHETVSFGLLEKTAPPESIRFNMQDVDSFTGVDVDQVAANEFSGSWVTVTLVNSREQMERTGERFYATRIGDPSLVTCINEARKHRRSELANFCTEFSARTCETKI